MEWTWLKDWWRLKQIKRRQLLRRKQKLLHAEHDAYSDDDYYEDDEEEANESATDDDEDGYDDVENDVVEGGAGCTEDGADGQQQRLRKRQKRKRYRKSDKNPIGKNDLYNNDDKNYNRDNDDVGNDIEINDDDDDDDFCFCDECLNGDTDFCESNDGMDSDCSTSSNYGKQVVVGICAMAKKTQSKPMKEILTRLQEFEFIKMLIFQEEVILKEPVENWPVCDCLVSFHSKGFPLEKAIQYSQLRQPFVINNLHMQYDIQDRRRVYDILEKEGIEIPRYAVLDRDSPDPKHHELIESEDHVEVNGVIFNKPFVEKPVSAEDHNIYIYYPTSAGGGSQRLFRKIGSRSSVYSPESRVRKTGSFIYEDFMPTDGTDVKVYTVGPDYAHAEARKSPALDGKVERDSEGKEIRYPVILNHAEKLISRKVCLAFKQTVCGFDLLRANGKSYVCDVNGFSFVKNSNKYYDDCAKILGNMILRELTPTLHIPWSVPFQLDDPPIVPTTFGKMMELRCVVAVIRHGDRTPKQKMKVEVRHPKFFEIFEKYDGYKHGHVKLKRPKQLQEILDIARFLLAEIQAKSPEVEIEEKQSKLEQLKSVLEMYGHFSGINRKVQMKYQPKGRPRGSSSDDDAPKEPSLVLILKWGGELTPAGRIQAEELGRIFRCMYPGGQGRQDYSGTQGLGLLRLHSTFRHDLKIYASDEGRVQMTAAAFAKGLLALEGELTPILVQMVKSANTNGLLDNDCDSSKYQDIAKTRLHELLRIDRDFTDADRDAINPCNSISINQALDFVKNPVDCCNHVHLLIKELLDIISVKKDDPKTKDAILYHGETWDLMGRRWEKIEKDFSTKSKQFDISKIPDIYDCIKYDLQHNQHTLQYDQAEELYIYAKYLADIVIPQEYGLGVQEKLTIGQGICTPLLKKIQADLQRNIEELGEETVNRLNPHYSHGVASPGRHVRTRLYFTSESHVHSLLTVLRYGELLNVVTDEQWRRAMDYISMVSELNYMSQIVIMLYEDPTKDPTSEERFHVELHFSPGVNCCVQKNLPPGPGFRPHSRNDSGQLRNSASDDGNTPRIDEENDVDEASCRGSAEISPLEENCELPALPQTPHGKHIKSKPIPIGSHHTVSGHEAMDLAKRLNEELAVQQQKQQKHNKLHHRPTKQAGSLEAPRPLSPDGEPRSRSYEQRDHQGKSKVAEQRSFSRDFSEIQITRNRDVALPIAKVRVTDSLTFFKIDSSTNELPLSDIDFSHHPGTPDTFKGLSCEPAQKRLLSMRRLESGEEAEMFVRKLNHLPHISPMATNERPLSCNCLCNGQEESAAHSHSKSLFDITDTADNHGNHGEYVTSPYCEGIASAHSPHSAARRYHFSSEDDLQLSSSAPASLLSCAFKFRQLGQDSTTNFNTASHIKLCGDIDCSSAATKQQFDPHESQAVRRRARAPLIQAQSAPVIAELATPFKFAYNSRVHVNHFTPIAEISDQTNATPDQLLNLHRNLSEPNRPHDPPEPLSLQAKNIPDLVVTLTASQLQLNTSTTPSITAPLLDDLHKTNNHLKQKLITRINPSPHTPINTSAITTSSITTTESSAVSVVSSSSVSSRRQRHSIAGQMSYMKMLGFGGFSKKMATSSSSLFSTAVISGSSSAPNLRDMIPCSSSSSVIEGFGGVPPIRPLETLHNALSLKQLDNYLQKMTSVPLFKTPASSPPKHSLGAADSLFVSGMQPSEETLEVSTPTNHFCTCHGSSEFSNTNPFCNCGCLTGERAFPPRVIRNATEINSQIDNIAPTASEAPATPAVAFTEEEVRPREPTESTWSKEPSVTSTEPSSPAVSDTCSHDTPSGEMSISLTSTEDGFNIIPTATEQLAKFFPQLDDDLNSVSVYAPMNTDTLNVDVFDAVFGSTTGSATDRSNCLTPISLGMDISMVANKGSITLSVDELDDDDEMTLSAATTPSLPMDNSEYKLETCYCCPSHAELPPAPTLVTEAAEEGVPTESVTAESVSAPPQTSLPAPSKSVHCAAETFAPVTNEPLKRSQVRKSTDPISPRIQKQISLFEGDKELFFTISSSINLPTQSLQLDARLRKFENLTQSTSNSNFPFESNTLKKSNLPRVKPDEMDFTKSCINLKSTSIMCSTSSNSSSASGSPQHKESSAAAAAAAMTMTSSAVASTAPHPGALIVKTKFIEPPKRITRSFRGKTQSMDSEILLHDYLTVPVASTTRCHSPSSGNNSPKNCTSPSARSSGSSRFWATKVVDEKMEASAPKSEN